MQKDGSIGLIDQTLQGREQLSYVDAYQRHSATEVAVMSGMSTVAGDAVTDFYGSGTMALGKSKQVLLLRYRVWISGRSTFQMDRRD